MIINSTAFRPLRVSNCFDHPILFLLWRHPSRRSAAHVSSFPPKWKQHRKAVSDDENARSKAHARKIENRRLQKKWKTRPRLRPRGPPGIFDWLQQTQKRTEDVRSGHATGEKSESTAYGKGGVAQGEKRGFG